MSLCPEIPLPGFSFANYQRNTLLKNKYLNPPEATKTGTTIVGIVFKCGVILGSDTRATSEAIICDKNSTKIHFLASNIYCCGAGVAADTEQTTAIISARLELHRFYTLREPRVAAANQMLKQYLFRHKGQIGAALILGGVDSIGAHVYSIYPHGSTDKLPFTTMGSGCLAAMGMLEARWEEGLEEDEGIKLVDDAIVAGIYNDLGSGSNVDLCIIRPGSVDYRRCFHEVDRKGQKNGCYQYDGGTTPVLSSRIVELGVVSTNILDVAENDL